MKMKALAGVITALFIASILSTAYASPLTVDLLAGQNLDAGDLIVEEVDIDGQHCLNITYVLAATLVDPDGVPSSGDEYQYNAYLAILEETTWANGLDFDGSNWAMYFQYPAAA